jgi:hypothetical protein
MNGHDPYGYLKDVLMGLPTQHAREIDPLLPQPSAMGRLRPFKPHVPGWSQRLRMLGQVEGNWMVKAVQLRIQSLASR